MHRRSWTIAVLLAALGTASAAPTQADAPRSYIVQLRDAPAASYAGGVAGLAATKPAAGQRLNVGAADVQAYIAYVGKKQSNVLASAAGVRPIYTYNTVFNGFVAMMTPAQARQVQAQGDVASVQVDKMARPVTSYTPTFLGLDKPNGLWAQLGGAAGAGEDVIIGMIDTGIAPDNPAFSDRVDAQGAPSFANDARLAYGPPPARWKGACETGPGVTLANCNNKLIGVRSFHALLDPYIASKQLQYHASEFVSARDSNGHGTHTASTAGGNHGVAATLGGGVLGKTSGMTPRARLAAYKVCWTVDEYGSPTDTGTNGCFSSEIVAAIEQAVKDGVQIISFSISNDSAAVSAVDIAFLGASNAGVFVSAAAGNEGPAYGSLPVNSIAPWVTTVGASTHDRLFAGDVSFGNGSRRTGASLNTVPLGAKPLVIGAKAAAAGAAANAARECHNDGSLDPAKVRGKIVVCDRGVVPLVDKSAAVAAAGGVGVVLLNVPGGDTALYPLAHAVPTVQLPADAYAAVNDYAAQPGATASIGTTRQTIGLVSAPVMAEFSSRGPNAYDPGILKPDLAAPGQSILASYAPTLTQAQHDAVASGAAAAPAAFALEDGTSMAAPHVSGIAALLIQKHPTWTPSMIKSALMTTAFATKPDSFEGTIDGGTLPWGQGAGQIDATRAADPGLVYAVQPGQYERYLCGSGYEAAWCKGLQPLKSADMNLASLTLASVIGKGTLTRTVTNVGTASATYQWSGSLPGFELSVSPANLTLQPGESKSYTLTVRATSAVNGYVYGSFQWSDGVHTVHSPLTVNATFLAAPPSVYGGTVGGSKVLGVGTGFAGSMATAVALKASTVSTGRIRPMPDGEDHGNCGFKDVEHPYFDARYYATKELIVPPGALALYVALFAKDYPTNGVQLGYYTVNPTVNDTHYGYGPGNDLRDFWLRPAPGKYTVCVLRTDALMDVSTDVLLHTWLVMPGDRPDQGSVKVMAPGTAYIGGTATVALAWSGLSADAHYAGAIDYAFQGQSVGATGIRIDTSLPPLQDIRPATAVRPAHATAPARPGDLRRQR